MPRRSVLTALASLLVASAGMAQETSKLGVVTGQVVLSLDGSPLGYAIVSIEAMGREQFTGADGRFTLPNLPAGRVTIRARRIGFTPGQVNVDVKPGEIVDVKLKMDRVAVVLPALEAFASCPKPGVPSAKSDPALYAIVDQLKQNATTYKLLVKRYPFSYLIERTISRRVAAGLQRVKLDTIVDDVGRHEAYEAGKILRNKNRRDHLMLPTLEDFASDAFLKSHCFRVADVEVEGARQVRLDFMPGDKIAGTDITGSIFLDATTYQIRTASYTLTKVPPTFSIRNANTSTVFRELVPSIPIIAEATTEWELGSLLLMTGSPSVESHRFLDLRFLKEKPGG